MFLAYRNQIDDRIKFTAKLEENGRVDMLDVQMEWNAGRGGYGDQCLPETDELEPISACEIEPS